MKVFSKPITHIILHTAEFDGHADKDIIKRWHLEKGWEDIGYHWVITGSWYDEKCLTQHGRQPIYEGAHAWGYNSKSLGICMTGNGDNIEWTQEQMDALGKLVSKLMKTYQIPIENVIGHRETFVNKINPRKTCPGKLIDMKQVRKHILNIHLGENNV
jgi:N-acetylmuramoyl-L-alanine amidase